jgi:hypothetical protein
MRKPTLPFEAVMQMLSRAEARSAEWPLAIPMEEVKRGRAMPKDPVDQAWLTRVHAAATAAQMTLDPEILEEEAAIALVRQTNPQIMDERKTYAPSWKRPRSLRAWAWRQKAWVWGYRFYCGGLASVFCLSMALDMRWLNRLPDPDKVSLFQLSLGQWAEMGAAFGVTLGLMLLGVLGFFLLVTWDPPDWVKGNDQESLSEETVAYYRERPESAAYINAVLASDVPFLRGDRWRLSDLLYRRQQSEWELGWHRGR